MRNKRILCFISTPNDAISWWRAKGPIQYLKRDPSADRFEFIYASPRNKDWDWDILGDYDAIAIHRNYTEGALRIAERAADLNIPIWYENDDNLFCVPMSNPAFKTFNDKQVKDRVGKIAGLAKIVSVTTNHLADAFRLLNKDVRVIPNAVPDDYWRKAMNRDLSGKREQVMMWRGSRTHDEDLESVFPALMRIANERRDWKHLWIGEPPWKCVTHMPHKAVLDGIRNVPKYFTWLTKMVADIGYVPLADNLFNRSKSNIGWQEMTMCGAVVIAPNFEEWKRPGIVNYKDVTDFYQKLKELMEDESLRIKLHGESCKYISEELLLSNVNHARIQLLEDLFS